MKMKTCMIGAAASLAFALAAHIPAQAIGPAAVSPTSNVVNAAVIGGGSIPVGSTSLFYEWRCNKTVGGKGYFATGSSRRSAERTLERAGFYGPFICTRR